MSLDFCTASRLVEANEKLARAIHRVCDIIEGRRDSTESQLSYSDAKFCNACGLFFRIKYGHHCARNAEPEDR
jgi:hypothetical protein